jgi:hypothetical protein
MPFVHYRSDYIRHFGHLPGIKRFDSFFAIYGQGISPIDRTGTITFPVLTKSLFPLPKMKVFTKTYEEMCDARAKELLVRADKLDVPLYAFWSGGVDSTCLLVSLLKQATRAQKERIVVLLSEQSISEYSEFYRKYIRGQLKCRSAELFPYFLGTETLIVNGEHNDQLFGSDIISSAINQFGSEKLSDSYDRGLFTALFESKLEGDTTTAELYVDLFERLREAAPIPIKTNFDLFWWINFSVKWQTVYARVLSYAAPRNAKRLSAKYLKDYYAPFYNTEAFQLWSMNNLDGKIRNGWRSYKWAAKEVIYEFTKDMDYLNTKIKRGSLQFLFRQQVQVNFLDERFQPHGDLPAEDFYQEQNDFA